MTRPITARLSERIRLVMVVLHRLRLSFYWPLYAAARRTPCYDAIVQDVRQTLGRDPETPSDMWTMLEALSLAQVRSVAYHRWRMIGIRTRLVAELFSRFQPGLAGLEIHCTAIGAGLAIRHGYGTVIWAASIGEDCFIYQQVTVGGDAAQHCPAIGQRVTIFPGAKVIGDISIGDGAVIGVNALVQRDLAPGEIVVAPRAQTLTLTGAHR